MDYYFQLLFAEKFSFCIAGAFLVGCSCFIQWDPTVSHVIFKKIIAKKKGWLIQFAETARPLSKFQSTEKIHKVPYSSPFVDLAQKSFIVAPIQNEMAPFWAKCFVKKN